MHPPDKRTKVENARRFVRLRAYRRLAAEGCLCFINERLKAIRLGRVLATALGWEICGIACWTPIIGARLCERWLE